MRTGPRACRTPQHMGTARTATQRITLQTTTQTRTITACMAAARRARSLGMKMEQGVGVHLAQRPAAFMGAMRWARRAGGARLGRMQGMRAGMSLTGRSRWRITRAAGRSRRESGRRWGAPGCASTVLGMVLVTGVGRLGGLCWRSSLRLGRHGDGRRSISLYPCMSHRSGRHIERRAKEL
jgi:hypothetical protein